MKKNIENRLEELGQAIGSDDSIVPGVMKRIDEEFAEESVRTETLTNELLIRRLIMSRFTRYAAAAVVIIAVLVGMNQIGGGNVTFADVIKPILNARTVIFDVIVGDEASGTVMHEIVVDSRIRRTISGMEGLTQILDPENGKMLVLDAGNKTAVYVDIKGMLQEQTRGYIEFVRKVLMELKDSPDDVERLGEQEIDGRKAIGFAGPNDEVRIWADPETAVPIRVEIRLGKLFGILKNFKFDEPIDDSQVSMDVPDGYTLAEAEVDFTKGTEEDFIASLRIWAEVLLDGKFPEAVGTEDYMKEMTSLGEKVAQSALSGDEVEKLGMTLPRGMFFVQSLEIDDKYHYAGKGVRLGDADKAIFWYRPKGSETYRVIYGDLGVKDVAEENLPR